jgi:hypothetical protein
MADKSMRFGVDNEWRIGSTPLHLHLAEKQRINSICFAHNNAAPPHFPPFYIHHYPLIIAN